MKSAAFLSVSLAGPGFAGSPAGVSLMALIRSASLTPAFFATTCAGNWIGLTSSQSTYGCLYVKVIERLSELTLGFSEDHGKPAALAKYCTPLVTSPLSLSVADS